jgi:hypothetical protein
MKQIVALSVYFLKSIHSMCAKLSKVSTQDRLKWILKHRTTQKNEEESRGGKNGNTGERQQNCENQVSFNSVFGPSLECLVNLF